MSAIKLNTLTPAHLIHPGEILEDELKARNISQVDFAKTIDIKRSQLNEYIKGKRDFNNELCLLVSTALEMEESIWLNLKQNYELDKLKVDAKVVAKLAAVEEYKQVNRLPKRFLKEHGIITTDKSESIENLRDFYGISNLAQLSQKVNEPRYAYHRKSEKSKVLIPNLVSWEQLVKIKAEAIIVKEFNTNSSDELIAKLKHIFKENTNALEQCKKLLAEYGIKLVHQSKPEKCAVDGFSFWSNGKPAIGLSLRYNRIDHLAFTLIHELGHVYLHLPNNIDAAYIDAADESGSYGDSKEEKEANAFTKENLIPEAEWEDFLMRYFKPDDGDFELLAEKCGIHPAIPFGRFCFEMNQFRKRTKIDRKLR